MTAAGEGYALLAARVPGYLPDGWTPDPQGAADALLRIAGHYADHLRDGVEHLPDRTRLAFLDRLGIGLLAAQPARVPLVFTLLPNSGLAVALPAGTQVAREATPPPPPAPGSSAPEPTPDVVFDVDESVTLTGARPVSLYSVVPGTDEWSDHSGVRLTGCTFFGDFGPVEHALYLGHRADLALSGTAEITLIVEVAPGSVDRSGPTFVWEYLSAAGWRPLDVVEDGTGRLTRTGRLLLRKSGGPDAQEQTVAGRTAYWVRARTSTVPVSAVVRELTADGVRVDLAGHLRVGDRVVPAGGDPAVAVTVTGIAGSAVGLSERPPGLAEGALLTQADAPAGFGDASPGAMPVLERIRARVEFARRGLEPEAAAADGLPVDPNGTVHPFGQRPSPFATFLVASKDVFGRGGARIEVHVVLRRPGVPGTAAGVVLEAEYYDGAGWRSLSGVYELRDGTKGFTTDAEPLTFRCPRDWAPVAVGGNRNHWLRIRVAAGDYGTPEGLAVDPADAQKVVFTPSTLAPPVLASVRLGYRFGTEPTTPHHCLAYNDFRFTDHSDDVRWPRRPFAPFRPVADEWPALHLGFDRALPVGLIGLYLAVAESPAGSDDADGGSDYLWEYRSARGWVPLTVRDETAGFRRSGMIQFVGPRDAVPVDGHGGELARVRARLKRGARPVPAQVRGLWTNAVWASRRTRRVREPLGIADGGPRQSFFVPRQHLPVLEGETVEVREWTGRGETWRTAVAALPEAAYTLDRDAVTGEVTAVWVRWSVRPHLHRSGPADRHLTLERATGLLRFGDGRYGRIPPAGSAVRATWTAGGGAAGNVARGTVTELRAAVPQVIGVTNVAAAAGGAETETVGRAAARGSAELRHRGRATSPADVEWLAVAASPAVAVARCLPATGPDGPGQRGYVSVVVVPDGPEPRPEPTPELLRRVRAHLAAAVPAPVAGRVRVLGPRYALVRVVAEVVPEVAGAAAEVEHRLLRGLEAHLHPTRGRGGRGWRFGQPVYQSELAALVEGTAGVRHAVAVRLLLDGVVAGEIAAVAEDALVASGDHEIVLSMGSGR